MDRINVFEHQTTYGNDYKRISGTRPKTTYNYARETSEPESPRQKSTDSNDYKDNETRFEWKRNVHIPFSLFWRPKPIINTNPDDAYPVISDKILDNDEAILTRPRVYMSPAVSIDDIDDKETRRLLCQFMYTSDWKKATEEAKSATSEKQPHNKTKEIVTDIKLNVDMCPPLPQQFRKLGKKWEHAQKRATVDPTKEFWIHREIPVNELDKLVPQETKREIRCLLQQDMLRLPHDQPSHPSYAGYQPTLSYGVSLRKIDLPVTHPFLSVSQAITTRYRKNSQ